MAKRWPHVATFAHIWPNVSKCWLHLSAVGDRMYVRPSLPEWAARLGWSNLSVLDADQQSLQLPPKYRDGPLADEV